jgi:hypothetical protein
MAAALTGLVAKLNLEGANASYVTMKQLQIGKAYLIVRFKYTQTVYGKGLLVYLRDEIGQYKTYLPSRFSEDLFTEAEVKKYNAGSARLTLTILNYDNSTPDITFAEAP